MEICFYTHLVCELPFIYLEMKNKPTHTTQAPFGNVTFGSLFGHFCNAVIAVSQHCKR